MYIFFDGASLKIAKNLIRVSGMRESLDEFSRANTRNIPKQVLLKQILGLSLGNLIRTMKEESFDRMVDPEDRLDILEDYVMENLREQGWIRFQDGTERMGMCQEIMAIAESLQFLWKDVKYQDAGAYFRSVKDLLTRLGKGDNLPLQDALVQFATRQYQSFLYYFYSLLAPFHVQLPVDQHPPKAVRAMSAEAMKTKPAPKDLPTAQEAPISLAPKPPIEPISSESPNLVKIPVKEPIFPGNPPVPQGAVNQAEPPVKEKIADFQRSGPDPAVALPETQQPLLLMPSLPSLEELGKMSEAESTLSSVKAVEPIPPVEPLAPVENPEPVPIAETPPPPITLEPAPPAEPAAPAEPTPPLKSPDQVAAMETQELVSYIEDLLNRKPDPKPQRRY